MNSGRKITLIQLLGVIAVVGALSTLFFPQMCQVASVPNQQSIGDQSQTDNAEASIYAIRNSHSLHSIELYGPARR